MASPSSEPSAKPEESSGNDVCGVESSETAEPIGSDQLSLYRLLKKAKKERVCTAKERISKMPPCAAGKRSSVYRGVTRHRWTGRYEAHLWDKSTWNQNQNKKGKQVYLGAYDDEEAAARAYDLAALKYWGPGTLINFPVKDYTRDLEEMQNLSREEYLASLRRKSSGFSRGISKYRPLSSRWESKFGRLQGADYLSSKCHGDDVNAGNAYVGGFCMGQKIDLSSYIKWWGPIKAHTLVESKHGCSEDTGNEASELTVHPTEPYEMPRLGLSHKGKNNQKGTTAAPSIMSILSQSAAYKSLQEKVSKKKEKVENEENESQTDDYHGKKALEVSSTSSVHDGGGRDMLGALFGGTSGGGLNINGNLHPLTPILSAPLLTNYSGSIDPLADPLLWAPLVPSAFPPGSSSHAIEITKQESVSDYTFFQQGV